MELTPIELISGLSLILSIVVFGAGMIKALWTKVNMNAAALAAFKLEVAKNYIGTESMETLTESMMRSEERMNTNLVALTARIDRMLTRLER